MSKVDALRALREARYAAANTQGAKVPTGLMGVTPAASDPAERQSEAGKPAKTKPKVGRSAPGATPALYVVPEPTEPVASVGGTLEVEEETALCGHRSMGNKSCSRPAGHPEKNHRYK